MYIRQYCLILIKQYCYIVPQILNFGTFTSKAQNVGLAYKKSLFEENLKKKKSASIRI